MRLRRELVGSDAANGIVCTVNASEIDGKSKKMLPRWRVSSEMSGYSNRSDSLPHVDWPRSLSCRYSFPHSFVGFGLRTNL